MSETKTPLLDELKKGPWPSFVKEIELAAENNEMSKDLLIQLEQSYVDKVGHWKHGGIVGVRSYGGGVIGRYTDMPEKVPHVEHFHTVRVNQPSGWFYTSDALRTICDIWERHGSGLTNMHGSTGDIILLGTKTEELQPIFDELSDAGWDLGGSGSDLRTPSCCNGMARCEWACFDSMDLCNTLTHEYQDELHRPMWPYKFKIKISACPNDCVASIARSDFSIIGTWKDDIQVNEAAVKEYADKIDIMEEVVFMCPTRCMRFDAASKKLTINNAECTRCMHCINVMPKALAPGKVRGATILIGAKAPIVEGAILGHVLIPFVEIKAPYTEIKETLEAIWDWWDEQGKMRERVGELINRVGMPSLLKALNMKPSVHHVAYPRENPFYFWDQAQVNEEIAARKKN
jgi:sulfite reductase alpha subunit